MPDADTYSSMRNRSPLEIYIHIPFCVKKCAYCDFLSFPAGKELQREYTDALLEEIRAFAAAQEGTRPVRSVFFGGGTPSLLPAEWIREIMAQLREGFPLTGRPAASGEKMTDASAAPEAEITLEANPGTLTAEKLRACREAGINRLSLGCQSVNDAQLQILGRIHTASQFFETFSMARDAGFSNISADLMSGLPGQNAEDWENSLRAVAGLHPEHISAYSLIIEEGTPFWELYGEPSGKTAGRAAPPPLPDEETERRMYAMTETILAEYGYHRYEISNYARSGWESVHNTGYWTGVEYVGFGLGAASLLADRRMKNTADLSAYLADPAGSRYTEEVLSEADRMAECMILGLRLMRGVSEETFAGHFGKSLREVYGEVIRRHVRSGLLEEADGHIRLTGEGISLSNVVMRDFLPE